MNETGGADFCLVDWKKRKSFFGQSDNESLVSDFCLKIPLKILTN